MHKHCKKVAFCLSGVGGYARNVEIGALAYIRETRRWDIRLMGLLGGDTGKAAQNWGTWKADGALVQLDTPGRMELAGRLDMPVVNIYDSFEPPKGVPTVICDNREAGRLAARHLLAKGFKHFGFVDNGRYYSNLRLAGFVEELGKSGHGCDILHHGISQIRWEIDREQAEVWLRKLPKPVAVMACSDLYGVHLVNLCNDIRLHVPDEVAIVGVDNDETLCLFCLQPLSSVAMPARRVGYEAAAMLDGLMRGKRPPKAPVLLPPTGVVERQSSDATGVANDVVRRAMRFIRDHSGQAISVADILREVQVCRAVLDRDFLAALGRTPAKEILRGRVELAKRLLTETDLKAAIIARQSGFADYTGFFRVFRQHTGMSPDKFRAQSKLL